MTAPTNAAGTAGGDAQASGQPATENAVPARPAAVGTLAAILANQAATADRYGDADRIAHYRQS